MSQHEKEQNVWYLRSNNLWTGNTFAWNPMLNFYSWHSQDNWCEQECTLWDVPMTICHWRMGSPGAQWSLHIIVIWFVRFFQRLLKNKEYLQYVNIFTSCLWTSYTSCILLPVVQFSCRTNKHFIKVKVVTLGQVTSYVQTSGHMIFWRLNHVPLKIIGGSSFIHYTDPRQPLKHGLITSAFGKFPYRLSPKCEKSNDH